MPKLIRITIILLLLSLVGCDNTCDNEILQRGVDPSGKVEFIYVRGNCGATTSYSHHIYIVPSGKSHEKIESVFTVDKIEKLELKWLASAQLQISYKAARIFKFTNFWQSKEVDNFKYEVKINLNDKSI